MDNKVILIIAALLLPPLGVFLKKGVGKDFFINLLLCLLIWFPAVVHAVYVVTKS